ncbi:MAG: CD225/dispanin family protein [Proteiniphilum sp.]|nr:CD225/dispanin family protein [Proteiniphilum sp.]
MEDQTERSSEDQSSMPPPVPPQQAPLLQDPSLQEPRHHEPPRQDPPAVDIPPLKPNNWLWQSIVSTILCCIPLGIVGIVYAAKVDSLYFNGQYDESERAAKKARLWTIIAFSFGLVYWIVSIILFATGDMPGYMESIIEESASGYNF